MPSDPPTPAPDAPGDPNPAAPPTAPAPAIPGDPAPPDPLPVPGTTPGDPTGDPTGDPAGDPRPAPDDAPGDPAAHLRPAAPAAPGRGGDDPFPAPDDTPDDVPDSALRIAEALVFASATPVSAARLAPLLPEGTDPRAVLAALAARTAGRGVTLAPVAGGWAFRTAPDLAPALTTIVEVPRRLPRAAMEALAIVAWHQPVTRPEIEEIRGASLSQATLELLLENGLVAPRGKKEAPGRPTLWGTTPRFLDSFGLNSLRDLPRREELLPEPGLPFPAPAAPADPLPAARAVASDTPRILPDPGRAGEHSAERPGPTPAPDPSDAAPDAPPPDAPAPPGRDAA